MVGGFSLSDAVRQVIRRNLTYILLISKDLISSRKLAKKILPDVAELVGSEPSEIKIDSVVKAIKRFKKTLAASPSFGAKDIEAIEKLLSSCHILVRSDLAVLTSRISAHLPQKLAKIITYLFTREDHTLHVAQASTAITLVFDECELEVIEGIISPDYTISINRNCSAIKLIAPSSVINQKGFFLYVLNLLATVNVNLVTLSFSMNELIMIVDRKDELTAFNVLKNEIDLLRKKFREPWKHT